MERNKPLRLASARALAARAACRRASLSVVNAGKGVGFRCVTGGSVGEFDIVRARLIFGCYSLAQRGSSEAFGHFRPACGHARYSPGGRPLAMLPAPGYAYEIMGASASEVGSRSGAPPSPTGVPSDT